MYVLKYILSIKKKKSTVFRFCQKKRVGKVLPKRKKIKKIRNSFHIYTTARFYFLPIEADTKALLLTTHRP